MSFPSPTGNTVVDVIIALVTLPIVLRTMWWMAEKVKGEAEKAQSPGLPDIPQIWDEMRELRVELRDVRSEAEEQRQQSNAQASEIFHLGHRVRELELSEGRLVRWTLKIRDGINDGTIPPYPAEPDWLLHHIAADPEEG